MIKRAFILLSLMLACVTLLAQALTTHATTPTPAPSKTPTPFPTATLPPTNTPAATATIIPSNTAALEAFTQGDLSVLTGNVQRPNGITWINDRLYIACTGDSSIYEIEAANGSTILYIFGLANAHMLYAETDADNELNIWAPDFERNLLIRIRRVGLITVTDEGLNGPWGIAYLDDESFLVTNILDNNVVRVTRDGQVSEFLSGLRSPTGMAVDEEGYIYVANNGSARRAIEWTTRAPETNVANEAQPLVSGLQNVTNVVMASDGYLYFAYSLGTRGLVGRVDPAQCRAEGGCTNDQVEIVLYSELPAPLAGLTISPDLRLFVHTIYRPEIYWVQLDQRP
ncbi:MAG: hypothetical protein HXY40_11345 [Chloroflexi bacterium]|nr:hypothetical protein [Chloroflexota bacterium]